MANLSVSELLELSTAELNRAWAAAAVAKRAAPKIPHDVQEAVDRSINSRTKSYRYVLPTQVLAKVVDPELDSRSLQEGSGLAGSFDARSLCHTVIVPFDRANHSVLGGSPEPYVNNPLRVPALSTAHRAAQRDKPGFDDLCSVVDFLETNPASAGALLDCIVGKIQSRLATVQIVYPVPNRASLKQSQTIIGSFLSERTGGVRLQAVSVALFRSIGEIFHLYQRVEAARINAADASTGSAADLICLDENNHVVLAVEVKDRHLQLRHIQDKLPAVREQAVRELLFIGTEDISESDVESVRDLIEREFITGQNVYVAPINHFLESCLILFAEAGRRQFLINVGQAIDDIKADLSHRQTWRDLLQQL